MAALLILVLGNATLLIVILTCYPLMSQRRNISFCCKNDMAYTHYVAKINCVGC